MQELIVLVDDFGNPIGQAEKLESHHADTPFHLAFSCYVFDDKGRFLVTQRALEKKVWPGVWTNSCCGHPAPGESMTTAIARRLDYELGMTGKDFELLVADYKYKTTPFNDIVENEFCPIYICRADGDVQANLQEVADHKWMTWDEYVLATQHDDNDVWSWWCKDQLKQLEKHPLILQYALLA